MPLPSNALYCDNCLRYLYDESTPHTHKPGESFAIVSDASNATVSGTVSVYDELASLEVESEYLTRLEKMIQESIDAHYKLTRNLFDKTIKSQKEEIKWRMQQSEMTIRKTRARNIQVKMIAINAVFSKLTSLIIFRQDVSAFFTELPIKCEDYGDFKNKIESLCCVFEVEVKRLRSLITDANPEWKSRKIITEWLKEKGISDYQNTVAVWDRICCLRNMPPTHPKMSDEHVNAIISFGANLGDYTMLWDRILTQFYESLCEFLRILESMLKPKV